MTSLHKTLLEDFQAMLERPTGVYVKVVKGVKTGTIAKVVSVSGANTYRYDSIKRSYIYAVGDLRLSCKGKREFSYDSKWCELMPEGEHETVYCNDPRNAPVTNDVMGNGIELGTVVAFADRNTLCVGVVRRITEKGGVFVETIRRGQRVTTGKGEEVRIPYAAEGTFVIKDESIDQIMIAKLADM